MSESPGVPGSATNSTSRSGTEGSMVRRYTVSTYTCVSRVVTRSAAHEADRVDVKQQRRRASVGRRFWIKDDRASKALIEGLNSGRILVKQITQI